MKATENKALTLALLAIIMLVQPALARGGGFGGGFGAGFSGSSHGFGGFGVHGFNAGFSDSSHAEERAAESGSSMPPGELSEHGIDGAKPVPAQQQQPNGQTSPQVVANHLPTETARRITQK